jgi:hydrophobe/amphiphile efflux-1 (HAE1) family protein
VFSDFFIDRPIFASVLAILIVLLGGISIYTLPIAEFPEIVPPTVQVTANYYGAGAEVVEKAVTVPIEEEINGVEGMIYMTSQSASDGSMVITCTFDVGYDLAIAAVDVQNKVQIAEAKLPEAVNKAGIDVEKQSTDLIMAVTLISPDGSYGVDFLGNYAQIHLMDPIARLPGVGQVVLKGSAEYAMRVWLDPDELSGLGLTAMDVMGAIQEQNQQVASGKVGAPPAPKGQRFSYTLTTLGRLSDEAQFEDIILRTRSDGSVLRLKDVARVELGLESYTSHSTLSGQPTGALLIYLRPGGNELDVEASVKAEMERLSRRFPSDLVYKVKYDTTMFVRESVREVLITLLQAIGLVFLVVFVFLQDWRSTLIPALTIPVSLIGAFVLMMLLGFSINTLTLFGLVLAIGLVVDDAIVVVENVQRVMSEKGLSPKDAARQSMREVTGPIVSTTLVLTAVFVPVALMPGITGQLYNQFALAIAFSVWISAFNALTLSPALCGVLLRPGGEDAKKGWFFTKFNAGFERVSGGYERGTRLALGRRRLVLGIFAAVVALVVVLFDVLATGFVPEEDQGYFIVTYQLPAGASLQRTREVSQRVDSELRAMEGVADTLVIDGLNLINNTNQESAGVVFVVLAPWDERTTEQTQIDALIDQARLEFAGIPEAIVVPFNAPPIPGLGSTGGFQLELQDLQGGSLLKLSRTAHGLIEKGKESGILRGLFTTFAADSPQLYVDIDRSKVRTLGVAIEDVIQTLEIYLGSVYVNEFNRFGRVWKVFVQADAAERAVEADVGRLKVRSEDGQMMPLNSVASLERVTGADTITHYNLYRAATINGEAAPGYSSGQAVEEMEKLAAALPEEYGYEWTGATYQQILAGNLAPIIFSMALILVFLVLAAQYESWAMPWMVLLAVPTGIFGSLAAIWARGLVNDIYVQIGLVVIIGLAAKTAILIVEFAKQSHEQGKSVEDAAMEAAKLRFRPILMTSFAFILGTFPLAVASGAGANSHHSLGTTVVGGMIFATLLGVFLVPVLYAMIQGWRERGARPAGSPIPNGRKSRQQRRDLEA